MARLKHPTTRSERLMGLLVLLALGLVGRWIFEQQFHFNAALRTDSDAVPSAVEPPPSSPSCKSPMSNFLPENLAPLSAPEQFIPDTLSDKIDGRAELYLSAHLIGLQCQQFAHLNDPSAWMEVFLYDMGDSRNAFAVYGIQRREDAKEVDVADFAYRTSNTFSFVRGRYYVEIVAATASGSTAADMEKFATRFCENIPGDRDSVPEANLFPTKDRVPGSLILYRKEGLGFELFEDLFVASYRLGETEATAFLTVCPSSDAAQDQAQAYAQHLLKNGGVEEPTAGADEWARLFNLFGAYELVFVQGRTVAGVHEAEKDDAEKLGARLYQYLGNQKP